MTRYLGDSDHRHGTPERLGVLVVNLGTPDAPTTWAVMRYLREFLWDPRVVEVWRPLWWLILHLVILPFRSPRSAAAYRSVWTEAGSPLLVGSQAQAEALRDRLAQRIRGPFSLSLGMRYGNPSIADALESLRHDGVRRLLVLPLYPQYSATTTASVFDAVAAHLGRLRWLPALRFIDSYQADPAYISALANSVREHRAEHGEGGHLLMSFHGLPQRYLRAGDPYHCQCHRSARELATRLGLSDDAWSISFQSRVGREPWLQPYTDERLAELARSGVTAVDVVCPGFATDCLETLEEIALLGSEQFRAAGGERLNYIPCLNHRDDHIGALADLITRNAAGWPEVDPNWSQDAVLAAAETAMRRAGELGAPR